MLGEADVSQGPGSRMMQGRDRERVKVRERYEVFRPGREKQT